MEKRQNSLDLLQDNFRFKVIDFFQEAKEKGFDIMAFETLRTQKRQEELYAQGRTKPGKIVTWTLNSYHKTGLAVDVVFKDKNGNPSWQGDYAGLIKIAKKYGIDNLAPVETAHFQDNGKPYIPKQEEIMEKKLIEFGIDKKITIDGKEYTYPSSVNKIPVFYNKSNGNTLAISYIKGYVPGAKTDKIVITKSLFLRYDYETIIKVLTHEFFHFVHHRYFNENENETLIDMYNMLDEDGFVGTYAKTQPAEFGAETFAYGYTYIEQGLEIPKTKNWNKGISVMYKYLRDRVERYKKYFN